MDRFLARCPRCTTETLLDTHNLRLLVPADPRRSSRAVFTCPDCAERTAIPVSSDVAAALQAAGVPASYGHPSLGPPARRPVGPPISHDDLLDFHQLLERPDWFAVLQSMTTPAPVGPERVTPAGRESA